MVHESLAHFFDGFHHNAHPMAMMCGAVGALSAFYHDVMDIRSERDREIAAHRLVAKMPTLAAMCYKHSLVNHLCTREMTYHTRQTFYT